MKGSAITYIMLLTFTELMSPCLLNIPMEFLCICVSGGVAPFSCRGNMGLNPQGNWHNDFYTLLLKKKKPKTHTSIYFLQRPGNCWCLLRKCDSYWVLRNSGCEGVLIWLSKWLEKEPAHLGSGGSSQ